MIGIVGGGLAGTALAKLCHERSIDFRWIKDDKPAASHISSGIINPVTGRKFVQTWNYELFKNIALDFYGEFIQEVKINKFFKSHDGDMKIDTIVAGNEKYLTKLDEKWIQVTESFQVDVQSFVVKYSAEFQELDFVINESFDHSILKKENEKWHYNDLIFDKLIFAEGIAVLNNPYFKHLDFRPNRGEVLIVDIPNFKLDTIKKHGKFICNFHDNFWIGSSTDIVPLESPLTTDFMLKELEDSLPNLIQENTYAVLNHIGALRSTTHDRRPYIGEHKDHKNLFVFNGFGTKGASLIPYCAQNLLAHILKNEDLNPEIDIKRLKSR
jgi:glycine oxidase